MVGITITCGILLFDNHRGRNHAVNSIENTLREVIEKVGTKVGKVDKMLTSFKLK